MINATRAIRPICLLTVASVLLQLQGCIGDKISIAKKVHGLPNTFKADVRALGEKVLAVKVYHFSGGETLLVWHIRAIESIPASGFQITVGDVPEGFVQVLPSPAAAFKPTVDVEYGIVIETDVASIHTVSSHWVGEGN